MCSTIDVFLTHLERLFDHTRLTLAYNLVLPVCLVFDCFCFISLSVCLFALPTHRLCTTTQFPHRLSHHFTLTCSLSKQTL
jgi:hypothetical protein